ncbi:MAG: hypothetical protein SZ59_C0001G0126 [candidate division TM6 bacterium GW2011_GWF2_28_16]|nr:MAG: hypothetical protein SZ59_C0001G0126 [candidate division TM6 bacterium GW2011_GWF2_28_16]
MNINFKNLIKITFLSICIFANNPLFSQNENTKNISKKALIINSIFDGYNAFTNSYISATLGNLMFSGLTNSFAQKSISKGFTNSYTNLQNILSKVPSCFSSLNYNSTKLMGAFWLKKFGAFISSKKIYSLMLPIMLIQLLTPSEYNIAITPLIGLFAGIDSYIKNSNNIKNK